MKQMLQTKQFMKTMLITHIILDSGVINLLRILNISSFLRGIEVPNRDELSDKDSMIAGTRNRRELLKTIFQT